MVPCTRQKWGIPRLLQYLEQQCPLARTGFQGLGVRAIVQGTTCSLKPTVASLKFLIIVIKGPSTFSLSWAQNYVVGPASGKVLDSSLKSLHVCNECHKIETHQPAKLFLDIFGTDLFPFILVKQLHLSDLSFLFSEDGTHWPWTCSFVAKVFSTRGDASGILQRKTPHRFFL